MWVYEVDIYTQSKDDAFRFFDLVLVVDLFVLRPVAIALDVTVGIVHCSLAVFLVIVPVSDVSAAVCPDVGPYSFHMGNKQMRIPLANVLVSSSLFVSLPIKHNSIPMPIP